MPMRYDLGVYSIQEEQRLLEKLDQMMKTVQSADIALIRNEYEIFKNDFSHYLGDIVQEVLARGVDEEFKQRASDMNWPEAVFQGKSTVDIFYKEIYLPETNQQRIEQTWKDHVLACELFFMKNRGLLLDQDDQEVDNSEFDFDKLDAQF